MQPGTLGHVSESTVAVVLVKAIAGLFWRALKAGSTEQKDVYPSIVVVVDESTSATICLKDVFL